jgi:glycosyltransferase involved in cell wall biosynthesis
MKIAVLAPIAWRTPPQHYGPWEKVASMIAEGLVELGMDVTLFATADSQTSGRLEACCPRPYEEDKSIDPKVWECLHISHLMEQADKFDIIHNHFDFLPLSYSRLIPTPVVTTIHGFSSEKILPVYEKYNNSSVYISISNSDRHPSLQYHATVYHGIAPELYRFCPDKKEYLLCYGRIHPDKGIHVAIDIAEKAGIPLYIAGLIQDREYYMSQVAPYIDDKKVKYLGNLGMEEGNILLGQAKALLHPIAFEEPFGLSVIEAMMCGTPVIAFERGSMPEIVEHRNTGFLVGSAEQAVAAVALLPDIDPQNCRLRAEQHFSRKAMVSSYLQIYEQVLSASPK